MPWRGAHKHKPKTTHTAVPRLTDMERDRLRSSPTPTPRATNMGCVCWGMRSSTHLKLWILAPFAVAVHPSFDQIGGSTGWPNQTPGKPHSSRIATPWDCVGPWGSSRADTRRQELSAGSLPQAKSVSLCSGSWIPAWDPLPHSLRSLASLPLFPHCKKAELESVSFPALCPGAS